MITIKSKITQKPVEYVCNENDFRIDTEKIYTKDEFGNEVYFLREAFYAEKSITPTK